MASILIQGTRFSFTLLPPKEGETEWANIAVSLQNDWISYADEGEHVSIADAEELVTALSRLLAGGYERSYSLALERAKITFELYPYRRENGQAVSREERRKKDCVVAVRMLLRSKDKKQFLGGVHTLLLHREELAPFAEELRKEYQENYLQRIPGTGKHRFVGVSPRGFKGCNYLYLDEKEEAVVGEYAWVRMGRRQIEQVVYVDSARCYTAEDAPYNPRTSRKILRKATAEEVAAAQKEWNE